MGDMGALKPWHLLVLLFLFAGPVLGYVFRDRLARTQWLLVAVIGAVFLVGGLVAKVGLISALGLVLASAGLVGAITSRQSPSSGL